MQWHACSHGVVAKGKALVSSVASVEKAIIPRTASDNLIVYTSQGLLLSTQKFLFLPYKYIFVFLVNMHNSKK